MLESKNISGSQVLDTVNCRTIVARRLAGNFVSSTSLPKESIFLLRLQPAETFHFWYNKA